MSTRDKGKGTRSKSYLGRYCKSTGGRACPRAYRYRSRSRSTNSIYVSTISSTILSGLSSSCSSRLKTSNGSKPPGGASSIMDVSLYRIRLNHASLARYDILHILSCSGFLHTLPSSISSSISSSSSSYRAITCSTSVPDSLRPVQDPADPYPIAYSSSFRCC